MDADCSSICMLAKMQAKMLLMQDITHPVKVTTAQEANLNIMTFIINASLARQMALVYQIISHIKCSLLQMFGDE